MQSDTVLYRSQEGAIAKWLRRLHRILNYQLLFEGAGSNPAGVEICFNLHDRNLNILIKAPTLYFTFTLMP